MGPSLAGLLSTSFFPHAFSGLGGDLFAVILALIALGLMFSGRSIIRGLAFLVVGLAGAAFGAAVGGTFLGVIGALIGLVVGFLVGGAIGLLLVNVGLGLALGYYGYLAVRHIANSLALGIVAGVILFIVGVAVANKLLELVTAVLGGVIFYVVLVFFGLGSLPAALVSIVLTAAGFYAQMTKKRKGEHWRM